MDDDIPRPDDYELEGILFADFCVVHVARLDVKNKFVFAPLLAKIAIFVRKIKFRLLVEVIKPIPGLVEVDRVVVDEIVKLIPIKQVAVIS